MSGLYESYETDPEREVNGILIDYGNFRVTVARAGGANKQYLKLLEAKTKPFKRAMAVEAMDNELSLEILKEVYAETIVKDWETKVDGKWKKGIEQKGSDKLLPVNAKNVMQTFINIPDIFLGIREDADRIALYRMSLREEVTKNS